MVLGTFGACSGHIFVFFLSNDDVARYQGWPTHFQRNLYHHQSTVRWFLLFQVRSSQVGVDDNWNHLSGAIFGFLVESMTRLIGLLWKTFVFATIAACVCVRSGLMEEEEKFINSAACASQAQTSAFPHLFWLNQKLSRILLFASGALATRFTGPDPDRFLLFLLRRMNLVADERTNAASGERLLNSFSLHFFGSRRNGSRSEISTVTSFASSPAWQTSEGKLRNSQIDNIWR